jgi:Glycosyl transferase family 2
VTARITVVIASTCTKERGDLLLRACDSVLNDGSLGRVLVVANGPRCDSAVLQWISEKPRVGVVRLASGSHPLARRVGAEMVRTDYISFLDDDDEYVAGSLDARVSFLDANPDIIALATNGFVCNGDDHRKIIPPLVALPVDSVLRALSHGWQSAMLTLRTARVDLSVLDTELRHHEWTYTALCLAFTSTLAVVDVVTFRYYRTLGSLSHGDQHVLTEPDMLMRALTLFRGTSYEKVLRRRLGRALNDAATLLLARGALSGALSLHLRALACPGGWQRYGLSVKIGIAMLRRVAAGGR